MTDILEKSIALRIGGMVPFTTIDFPGKLSAVLFCQGCPWRCRYCQNVELMSPTEPSRYSWEQILAFLQKRKGLLDAVVFSGGEPVYQKHLIEAMQQTKALGFAIGLHTGGGYPKKLKAVLPYVDWVGFDVKALEADYAQVTGVPGSGKKAWESLALLVASGVEYECRTTVHWDLLSVGQLRRLANSLAAMGVKHYSVQAVRVKDCLDDQLKPSELITAETSPLFDEMRSLFPHFVLRV